MRKEFPILEYGDSLASIIEFDKSKRRMDMPEYAAICFLRMLLRAARRRLSNTNRLSVY
ncbi:MAG: hypothetical protein ACOX8W_11900 [bacterium]|jgi:hypothetical protein